MPYSKSFIKQKSQQCYIDKSAKFTCNSKTIETLVSMPVIFDTLIYCWVFNSDIHYSQRIWTVSVHRHMFRSLMNHSSNIYVSVPVCPLPDNICFQLGITQKLDCLPNTRCAVVVTIRTCWNTYIKNFLTLINQPSDSYHYQYFSEISVCLISPPFMRVTLRGQVTEL